MLAAIQIDPYISKFVMLSLIIIVIGFILKLFKQPSLITYILVGLLVGPFGLGIISDETLISNLGSLGLVLLLFFIGMEIHLPDLVGNWKVSVLGTLAQIFFSILAIWILGKFFDWNINQVVTLGFVISLSSTAVIIKLLQDRNQISTVTGKHVLSILLAQDVLIVPMMIIIGYMGGQKPDSIVIIKQILGAILIIGVVVLVLYKKEIKIPFEKQIMKDHEMQVFIAFTLCFGFSLLTAFLGLSAALGAFVGGILMSSTKSTEWIHDSLLAFKIMFVALFFVSIGMLIDLPFLWENLSTIALLVLVVFLVNNTINLVVMRIFCRDWKISFYAAAMLSQIGEFSFIIVSMAYFSGIIGEYVYQLTVSAIAFSLLLSPFWINITQKLVGMNQLSTIFVKTFTDKKG